MNNLDFLVSDLPSPEAARRFFGQFAERNPSHLSRLSKDTGLFSDVLTLASYSPLFAATLIQNPDYVSWLARKRSDTTVRDKDELLESLARFSLTSSQIDPGVLFARFRRRELLRIFLRDIRRLGTIAEITEEISNLADGILEHALRLARQEMDNRYGAPFEDDEKDRKRPSDICIVSLGKLGSRELNYSSDIDLLFIYSADGSTTGNGSRGSVTNREYFVKLAEHVTQLLGRQSGEGAAYRVDMRLRPHGRVGALALSVKETVRYYLNEAQGWEQQVLIRSRASAGSGKIFRLFIDQVKGSVFREGREPGEALRGVYRSKEKIDHEQRAETLFDVKLGRGGIREIEFIAQALQLAYGGADRWLRVPHTLISIARLADRAYLSNDELSWLSSAYEFLRRLEHILQMEHGLQTHSVPKDADKLLLIAGKMRCADVYDFDAKLAMHTENVHTTFLRVFGEDLSSAISEPDNRDQPVENDPSLEQHERVLSARNLELRMIASIEKVVGLRKLGRREKAVLSTVSAVSPKFAEMIASMPRLAAGLEVPGPEVSTRDHGKVMAEAAGVSGGQPARLNAMRAAWSALLLEIGLADIYKVIAPGEARRLQTKLAEASIVSALNAATAEVSLRNDIELSPPTILALGKLGSGTLDYDSDLDVIFSYAEPSGMTDVHLPNAELYSRVVEQFIALLSDMTRDGNLYRVDLRLRPYGKNGPNVTSKAALVEYIEQSASVWELLAYVQMRFVGGRASDAIESAARDAIRRRAAREDLNFLRRESRAMRIRLEETHGKRIGREIDIKFSSGGLLDVYFVVRYLQLSEGNAVPEQTRSTSGKLEAFHQAGVLSPDDFAALHDGHAFLSTVDHNIRLIIGRSSKFPRANHVALNTIAERMDLSSPDELLTDLAIHRMNIRNAFDKILTN